MQFRVSSWNVNNPNFRDTHAELLRRVDTDLLALQEISQGFYQELTGTGLFDWSAFSLSLRPPQREEGRSRRLRCAVFGRSPFQICSAQLLEELPFPGTSIDRDNQFEHSDEDVQFSHSARSELGKN
jgi:hypothetical protein